MDQPRSYGHTTRAPPGVSLPSRSRTWNLRILDPAFKPLRYSWDNLSRPPISSHDLIPQYRPLSRPLSHHPTSSPNSSPNSSHYLDLAPLSRPLSRPRAARGPVLSLGGHRGACGEPATRPRGGACGGRETAVCGTPVARLPGWIGAWQAALVAVQVLPSFYKCCHLWL
jgi:hypothetical protein